MTDNPSDGHRDRSGGLVALGVLEIAGGCLCLALAALFVIVELAQARSGQTHSHRSHQPGIFTILGLAVIQIWLGAGSIQARRWARALWVCVCGITVATGVMGLATVPALLTAIEGALAADRAPLPPAALLVVKVATVAALAVFLVAIPSLLFAFYRSPHVRRTCELRDPAPSWTDRCPLPVLALGLYCLFMGWSMLTWAMLGGVFPWFGSYLTGPVGAAADLLGCGLWVLIAWRVYRLGRDGWWLALAWAALAALSAALTVGHGDFSRVVAAEGLDARAAQAAGRLAASPTLRWAQLSHLLPLFLWIAWVRRYFGSATGAPPKQEPLPA
ncbi:MAG TPA: hypothetical protein VHC86_11565 [Opitutaceae bacterium]|nr:hypothetical protein [Opitutaceae bacterium]